VSEAWKSPEYQAYYRLHETGWNMCNWLTNLEKKIRKNINDTSSITTEVYKSSSYKCEHKKDSMVSIKNEPKSISSSIYATYASDQVPNNEGILTEQKVITYLEQQMWLENQY
jgi:hypothetical protein